MTTSRGFNTNYVNNGMNFNNLDDMQPPIRRLTPIQLRSDNQVYQNYEARNGNKYRTSESKGLNCCSKQCVIGLIIGLLIGAVAVVATAVPIALTKTCGSSSTSAPSSIGTISSTPNWTGTFLMDNGCDTTVCCCLTNQITLTQITGNQLQIAGSATGQCALFGSTVTITISIPTGFQTGFFWGTEPIRLQLGQDNSYLSFVNTGTGQAGCSATALRTSSNDGSLKSMNMIMVMFILLITICIIK